MFKQNQIIVLLSFVIMTYVHAAQLSDPTRPLIDLKKIAKPHQQSDITLTETTLVATAIIKSSTAYKAYINNKLVEVGDTVSGYRVTAITFSSVTLIKGTKTLVLSVISKVKSTSD